MKAKEVRCNVGMWNADDALMLIESIYMNPVPVKAEDFEEMETETETVSRDHKRGRAYRRNERNKHIAKRKSIPYMEVKFDGMLDKGTMNFPWYKTSKKQWVDYCKNPFERDKSFAEMKVDARENDARKEKDAELPEPFETFLMESILEPFYAKRSEELIMLWDEYEELDERKKKLEKEIQNIEYDMMDLLERIRAIKI